MVDIKAADRKGRKAIEKANVALERLAIEYVPIDSISPNSYNPNRQSDHDFQLLINSIIENGFTQPVIVQQKSREIVDGEHRWRAVIRINEMAQAEGKPAPFTEIPVVFVEWNAEQMRFATLTHNLARGSEDIELVAAMMRDLQRVGALEWVQESLLMSDTEIQRMLEDIPAPEALAAEEFSRAWVPEGTNMGDGERQGETGRQIGGAPTLEGSTREAADNLRAAEIQLAAAKSDEERQAALRDRDVYRVALSFTGEQAPIVRQVLGSDPATKLLEMCRRELQIEA